ncbi:hypothetical protein [Candidatus Phycosocius spiralis]|uniref:Uncharacterized protein n=1 Tax=Candidatus Phycosocius spiralis TaxID=2815099 RepID=A0ABQ4PYF8_9PROT|nr:hypothetical protein [Candidatus Phycosocius spiralis]GIU68052.1 hypothetical protein PsB1_2206 [Candidatus Phycosocius spiralis]
MLNFQTLYEHAGLLSQRPNARQAAIKSPVSSSDVVRNFLDFIQDMDQGSNPRAPKDSRPNEVSLKKLNKLHNNEVSGKTDEAFTHFDTSPFANNWQVEDMSANSEIHAKGPLKQLMIDRFSDLQRLSLHSDFGASILDGPHAQDQDGFSLSEKSYRRPRRQKESTGGDLGMDPHFLTTPTDPEGVNGSSAIRPNIVKHEPKPGSGMDVLLQYGEEGLRIFAWASQLNRIQKEKLKLTLLEIVSQYGFRLSDLAVQGPLDHPMTDTDGKVRTHASSN